MTSSNRHIETNAAQLAEKYSDKNKTYVDVKLVAEKLGLTVEPHDLGPNISGVLYIDKGKGTIGYNKFESPVRQRFTIAHEIGHFILHRLQSEIFVDKKEFKVMYRAEHSVKGDAKQEREANAFAAALLMPKERLTKELQELSFDLGDDQDDAIQRLAELFKVSTQAMAYRISNLNLG